MKELNQIEMSNVNGGGLDCSLAGGAAFTAGAGLAGALFFGVGGLFTAFVALNYWVIYCGY